jgi:translation initiation factor 1
MGRLFARTPWDRPPTCERCGKLEPECTCPPPGAAAVAEPVRIDPGSQTARLRLEKRSRGKLVTLVTNLDPAGNDLAALAAQLKSKCGTGGTVKDAAIELQGDQVATAEQVLQGLGYKTRRG